MKPLFFPALLLLSEWERLSIPLEVTMNDVKDELESFRQALRTERGFFWLAGLGPGSAMGTGSYC